jgi:transcriptional regulator with XRE-family HTH domain
VRRGARGSGVTVDPQRVRQARVQAGLSLRAVAGEEVSPTFIHFVERGISRPSRPVLALIARRTGQPISYFMAQPSEIPQQAPDLAAELARLADRARNLGTTSQMATVEREAMKLIELTLRQAAQLIKAIERNGIKATKRH